MYQTTKKTIGTPDDDPAAYRLILNGIESTHANADLQQRKYYIDIRKTDGGRETLSMDMQPGFIDPELTDTYLEGDFYVKGTELFRFDGGTWL